MESNPHDRFARRAFADLDVMRAHLRGFLPPAVTARLDLDRLRREPDVHLDSELRVAALAHLLLKYARADDLLERLGRWAELLRSVLHAPSGLDALRTLLSYVFAVRGTDTEQVLARTLLPHLDARDQETVMSDFKSYADVLREEGMAKGHQEGRRREAADKLLRLLRRRFDVPDAIAARIDAAPVEDLDLWFDRALDAERLEDVLGR
ncbi:MAG: Rpn family recombination-promoting nuclease/putative transposase [Planctomycetota bacterium JB042]